MASLTHALAAAAVIVLFVGLAVIVATPFLKWGRDSHE